MSALPCSGLAEAECYRQCETYTHWFAALSSRCPLRHGCYHAHGFLVERWVYRAQHLWVYDGTIFVDDELYENTALNAVVLSYSWVFEVLVKIVHEGFVTTRE